MAQFQIAQKAVIADGDRILMVRKSGSDPHNPGRWELPGGRMKESEDVNASLVREVREETGLVVMPGEPIDIWQWQMSWHGEDVSVVAISRYCALSASIVSGHAREDDDYLTEQRWVPISDLNDLDIIPSQASTINRVMHGPHCR